MKLVNKIKSIDYGDYEAPNLNLEKRKRFEQGTFTSCGSTSLSLITGINVHEVEKYNPRPTLGWTTNRMTRFLREKGYVVIELTQNNILSNWLFQHNINHSHCILINAMMSKEDNSSLVLHDDTIWHCFDKEDNGTLYFINKQIQDILLVYHPKWDKLRKRNNYRYC